MNRYRIFLLLCSLQICMILPAQENQDKALQSFLEKFSAGLRNQDKLQAYLITDKSMYKAGESIWFSAFLLNAVSRRPAFKNGFLFVDLVNEKDNVIQTVILDGSQGQLNSRIAIASTVPAGYYWIRAYTRSMTESGGEGVWVQPLYIFSAGNNNILPRPHREVASQDSVPALSFYPEGNCIITGASSGVALYAGSGNGPLATEGSIRDNRDSIVAKFSTNSEGLGKFVFEPSGYRKYKAVINWKGKEISYPLPAFNFKGAQLSATREGTGYKLRTLLGDSIYHKDFLTYVVAVWKDSLVFASVGKGQYELIVEKEKLVPGINTFYLLDKEFKFLSERRVYRAEVPLQIKLSDGKESFERREKGTFTVSVVDAQQHPVPALVTVSVTDTLLSPEADRIHFAGTSCPPMTGDQFLSQPLANESEDVIDLVMLARPATYPVMNIDASRSVNRPPDSLLYIRGAVLDKKGQPAAGKFVTLVSKTQSPVLYADTSDTKGRFRFPLEKYTDSTEFIIEAKSLSGRAEYFAVVLDPPVLPALKTPACLKRYLLIQPQAVRKYFKSYLVDESVEGEGKSLSPVLVKSAPKQANYDVSKRISSNSVILASDKINERVKISDAIQMVGGMQVMNGYLVMLGPSELINNIGAQSEPILILNGAQLSNTGRVLQYLNTLNPRDIDFIEILKGPEAAMFGVRGGNGAISINTRNRDNDPGTGNSSIRSFYPRGIAGELPFPNRLYDKKNRKATDILDNRSTLYWSGQYFSNSQHIPALTFYTNDIPSTYRISVTGITLTGDFIYKSMLIRNN